MGRAKLLLATAAAFVLALGAWQSSGEDRATTSKCEILVAAPLESEVIDATDHGSTLLWKWRDRDTALELVSYWKKGLVEKAVPRIDGYTHRDANGLSENDTVVCNSLRQASGSRRERGSAAFIWAPQTGGITLLPLLDGYQHSYGYSISRSGKSVCGFQTKPGIGNVPVVWTRSADGEFSCVKLPVPYDDNPLVSTAGIRISPNGQIIVAPITVDIVPRAMNPYVSEVHMWTKEDNGQWTRQLRTKGGLAVHAVNDHGTLVGNAPVAVGALSYPRAFVCTQDKGFQMIGVLDGDIASDARDINNRGIVVGWSTDPYGRSDPENDLGYDDPFVWTATGGMRKIVIASTPSRGGHGSVTTITDGNRIGGRVTIVDELNEPAFTALLK